MVDAEGRPLGRQYYCPKHDKKLSSDEIVRGYETDDGKMIVVTDEELESVAPEMTRDIELRTFVPFEQIPPTHYQRAYFLAPSGRSAKAYHLLARTMERTGRVGIGTFVMRGHEYLVAILSDGGLLRAETLRFADELRKPDELELPRPKKAPAKQVTAFSKAIDALTRDALDMGELSDRYSAAIQEIVEKKQKAGEVVDISTRAEAEDEEDSGNVVDLVAILRQRLSAKASITTADAAAGEAGSTSAGGERRASRKSAKGKSGKRGKAAVVKSGASAGDLRKLSKAELYERAQKLDIPGRTKMGKTQLAEAIRKAA
jgi:DNA end-binding protein Ku